MPLERFREAWKAQPFKPFILHLADGRNALVRHPEWVATSPSGRTVVIYEDEEHTRTVDLLLVTELEVRPDRSRRHKPQAA